MDAKFTKGPLEARAPGRIFIGSVRNFRAFAELYDPETPHGTLVDYAKLFAAAPDLYEALREIMQLNDTQCWFDPIKARAALAKAAEGT